MSTVGIDNNAPVLQDRRQLFVMGRSAGVRLVLFPISAILGIIITRLIINEYGRDAFAQYGLLVGIGQLLPFADLGMSAALMNAIGGSPDPKMDLHVRDVLITALRVLSCSACVLIAVALTMYGLGWWPTVLGDGLDASSGPIVATICLSLIGLTMPLGVGQRVLVALQRNDISIALGGLQSPLVLGSVALLVWVGSDAGGWIPIFAYLSTALIMVVACGIGWFRLRPIAAEAVRGFARVRSVRGARVSDVAWPTVVQMIALPLAMQSDRIVLSHLAGVGSLAEYNLGSQMFTPIWGVVTAAGVTLWPVFARDRAAGRRRSPMRMSVYFGFGAGAMALVIALFSPMLARFASGGEVGVGALTVVLFSALMTLQGVKYPLGMFMTDAAGLRYQAYMVVLMLPCNLGLSVMLAHSLGPAGPILGSVIGVLIFQVIANVVYVRRQLARGTAGS